jgi:hypothetical protein
MSGLSYQAISTAPNTAMRLEALRSPRELDARIEDYLDRIYAPMVGRLCYERRQELRREMRAHLGQLIAAHEELGSDNEEAIVAALRQFGPPELVAERWLDQLPAERCALGSRQSLKANGHAFSIAAKRLAIGVAAWVAIGVFFDRNISGTVPASLYISLGASIPCVTGYLLGRRFADSRPELAILGAQACVIPCWPFFLMWMMNVLTHRQAELSTAAIMGAVSFLSLAPLGCLSAWIGKVQYRRDARKPIAS